jgi:hypothetical protein
MAVITQRGFPVDFSKFKVSDWLMIGGGAAMLILGFVLDWTTVSSSFGSAGGDGPFNYFFTGGIAWILVVAVGGLAFANANGNLPKTQPWPLIFLIASGVAVILMILRLILGARFDFADRGIGMYGAFVWAAISVAGAYMGFKEAGGELGHLTDMDKMKSSFSGNGDSKGDSSGDDVGGDTPPPPPPPAPPAPPADPAPPAPPADPAPPAPPAD